MAYSPIEQSYIDGIVSAQFPDPDPVMLADSGQVKSDAQAGFGTISPIPRNKGQEALGYVGELLTKAGVELDKVGLDVPLLGRITLKDLTVGESGKVLEDMSYGFMPVEGAGGFISGTTRIKPDAALELMNIAPTVGAAVKMGGKAALKGAGRVIGATRDLPVGLGIKDVSKGMDDLGFYSAASRAIDNIQQPKGTGDQFLKQIEKTPGVKPDEIKWTGLDDFLKSKKTVTKQEVQDYMAANRVEIKEVQIKDPTESDIQAFLDDEMGQGYTRQEAIDYLRNDEGATKFSKYTLPGGENYREVLLTLPANKARADNVDDAFNMWMADAKAGKRGQYTPEELASITKDDVLDILKEDYLTPSKKGEFKSQHFDQPNILAHLRVNDRVDVDGKKVLFVEEVQSDWHQAGRKRGYAGDIKKELEAINAERTALMDEKLRYEKLAEPYVKEGKDAPQDIVEGWTLAANKLQSLQMKQDRLSVGVPDAPFKTNWQELAMKRAIQMAAEGGYERIAFTTGKTQAARYDLSKQINDLTAEKLRSGTMQGKYSITATDKNGKLAINEVIAEDKLEDFFGKDLAKKIIDDSPNYPDGKQYKGIDLQVGGEGMSGFYDNILPKFLDKYGKKWDAKTGTTKIRLETDAQAAEDANLLRELGVDSNGKSAASVHYIDITPKMKESVITQGQPMFAVGAGAGAATTQKEEKPKESRIKYDANGRRVK